MAATWIVKGVTMSTIRCGGNQHPLAGESLPSRPASADLRLDGADLFGQALELPAHPAGSQTDQGEALPSASDASLIPEGGPRLSLVLPEDHEDRGDPEPE